jgi:hypothetical protein
MSSCRDNERGKSLFVCLSAHSQGGHCVSFLFDYFVVSVNKNVCDEVVDLDHMFCDHDSHDGPVSWIQCRGSSLRVGTKTPPEVCRTSRLPLRVRSLEKKLAVLVPR